MAQYDQHITTEQLSAFLDDSLTADEQNRYDRHLKTCERCQQELADLRQTVALLRALPQPALPRSFVLPVETTQTSGTSRRAQQLLTTARADRPRAWPTYVRRTVQTISTLAAVIGIVFLLSGLLATSVVHPVSLSSAAMPASGANRSDMASHDKATTRPQPQQSQEPPQTITKAATPKIEDTKAPENGTQKQEPAQSLQSASPAVEIDTLTNRAVVGLLLLLLGIAGLFLSIRQRKRQEDRIKL